MAHNSTYTGVQVDAAVAKHFLLEGQGGAVSANALTTRLNDYLTKTEAATIYATKNENLSLTSLSIGVATPDFTSNALEVSGRSKFNGPIFTSWYQARAVGSYGTTVADPAAFISQVKYSNGCIGSVSFNGGTTWNGIPCNNQWYNFVWIPHRWGGDGYGGESGDNCNYGTLLLYPMNFAGTNNWNIRFSGGNVAQVTNFQSIQRKQVSLSLSSFNAAGNSYYKLFTFPDITSDNVLAVNTMWYNGSWRYTIWDHYSHQMCLYTNSNDTFTGEVEVFYL